MFSQRQMYQTEPAARYNISLQNIINQNSLDLRL